MFRKRYWISLVVAVLVIASLVFAFYPRVEVRAEGTLSISVTTSDIPQFDIAKISDIPAEGVVDERKTLD